MNTPQNQPTTHDAVVAAADRLALAQHTRIPGAPVRDLLGSTDIEAAYRVQALGVERRIKAGARVSGRKIGLTSPAVQAQLGVDQPDFGVLFDDMAHPDGASVPVDALLQPKVEAEVAFLLGTDLDGDLGTADDPTPGRRAVRAAVAEIRAAIEIVDSRVADWDITIVDTVADNGSAAAYVLGEQARTLDEVVPREVTMRMSIDGDEVSTGHGSACLGDPLDALLWLARTAQSLGDPLRAGQVVLSGALGPMAPVASGESVHVEISGLGTVTAHFSGMGAA